MRPMRGGSLMMSCCLRPQLSASLSTKNARCKSAWSRRTTTAFSAERRISLCENTEACSSAPYASARVQHARLMETLHSSFLTSVENDMYSASISAVLRRPEPYL